MKWSLYPVTPVCASTYLNSIRCMSNVFHLFPCSTRSSQHYFRLKNQIKVFTCIAYTLLCMVINVLNSRYVSLNVCVSSSFFICMMQFACYRNYRNSPKKKLFIKVKNSLKVWICASIVSAIPICTCGKSNYITFR